MKSVTMSRTSTSATSLVSSSSLCSSSSFININGTNTMVLQSLKTQTQMRMLSIPRPLQTPTANRRPKTVRCEVALKPSDSVQMNDLSSSSPEPQAKIGARVRVKVPLKVYHVPKVPELDLTGMEGQIKQYVGLWNGKRISANLPYKVEFVTEIPGRGPLKFFAHLKEDEFEYI